MESIETLDYGTVRIANNEDDLTGDVVMVCEMADETFYAITLTVDGDLVAVELEGEC